MSREAKLKSGNSPSGASALNPRKLKSLYLAMLQCRMISEKARLLRQQGKCACDCLGRIGDEATVAGSVLHLSREDCLAPSPHDFVSSFIKGMPLEDIFTGLCSRNGRPGPRPVTQGPSLSAGDRYASLNILRPASALNAQFSIGAGVAFAYKMRKNPPIVLAFRGPESPLPSSWPDVLNFAGERKIPMVYVIKTNMWKEAGGPPPAAPGELSLQAQECGIPLISVDGNDAVAIFRVAQEAIRRAREGHGPTVIECQTWGHLPAEMKTGRRPKPEEMEHRGSGDPVLLMENYLKRRNIWSDAWKHSRMDAFNKELDIAAASAQASHTHKPGRGPQKNK